MVSEKGLFVATSILIATTMAIGITFIQWVVGLVASFEVNQLQILHSSYIDCSNNMLHLHVRNLGAVPTVIQVVEIVGFERIDSSSRFRRGEFYIPSIIVNPKTDHVVSLPLSKNYNCGIAYQVRVYTSTGNAYTAIIYAE
ncbi:MAG: hypothetical protein N3D82_01635 [Ignisphaera sp.]|nr:hypothetical protein [Ignisphaera sp.]MCX8167720.1 hypothetical protein [Ignisphaera sp.]MDW8085284.1 hypothetical protein [Ignisphaera sp.]